MTAREIAENFIKTMNPSRWDGSGNRPESTPLNEVLTYHLDEYPEINLADALQMVAHKYQLP